MKFLYRVWGKVQPGNNRGKALGFPTVNIPLHKNIPEGVYISKTKIENREFSSLTFIGAARTFDSRIKKVETYIFDFDKSVYGKWVSVSLFKKIRGNIKFNSKKELVEQIKKDLIMAKDLFKSVIS